MCKIWNLKADIVEVAEIFAVCTLIIDVVEKLLDREG